MANKRKNVSIKDVARESQSSLTTVSLVLNNRAPRISRATRERVLETVNRLGYRPSRLAQGLQSQRSGCLAILLPQLRRAFADAYFGELISAIHDCAQKAGYKILLEVAHPDYVQSGRHVELFDRHFVDGVLCLGVTNRDTFLKDYESGTRPTIIVNNYLPGLKLNRVNCDYEQAGDLAGRHLLELGHRNFGLIHGASEVQTTRDHRSGFEKALAEYGVKLPESHACDGLYTEEGGEAAAIELLRRAPKITAVLAGNDKMAIGAISGIKKSGLRVPQDVSVVGCDDIHQGEFCDPPVTTVHTPLYELGTRGCMALLDLIEGRVKTVEETHPVSLTIRHSTCAVGAVR
jgi:DNA-binding LacI/PurR family transcriptional regulator